MEKGKIRTLPPGMIADFCSSVLHSFNILSTISKFREEEVTDNMLSWVLKMRQDPEKMNLRIGDSDGQILESFWY